MSGYAVLVTRSSGDATIPWNSRVYALPGDPIPDLSWVVGTLQGGRVMAARTKWRIARRLVRIERVFVRAALAPVVIVADRRITKSLKRTA